ncbi:MAG: GyrI-like domain-containing protein [candidate division Zixibacteria bacterium]|nr:GyrI-like domain-containing protein [candidate division Zixibacteria bacterium]
MEIQTKDLTVQKVAYIRHMGPYQECGPAWEKLYEWAMKNGIDIKKSLWIGASYDDPENTPPEKIRYDACVVIPENFKEDDTVKVQELPGGKYAMAIHMGAYKNIGETYKKMFSEGLPKADLSIRMAPCYEYYIGDCTGIPEEKLKTELYIPIS